MLPEGTLTFQLNRPIALIKTFGCAVKFLPIVFQLVAFCESCTDARLQIQEFSYPAFLKSSASSIKGKLSNLKKPSIGNLFNLF
jgi:hypothetical protein